MTVTIWHNPRCSKSRQTLDLLKSNGVEPTIREYLKAPPSTAEIEKLIDLVHGLKSGHRQGAVWVMNSKTLSTVRKFKAAGVPTLAYGNFISVGINFLILAFVIFLMVKQINRLKRNAPAPAPAPAAAPPTPEDVLLLREIRDSLRQKS